LRRPGVLLRRRSSLGGDPRRPALRGPEAALTRLQTWLRPLRLKLLRLLLLLLLLLLLPEHDGECVTACAGMTDAFTGTPRLRAVEAALWVFRGIGRD